MITTEELIRGFSEESFAGWCRGKFADFVPKSERLDEGEFSGARQIGYVRTLADGELNRPLLVVAVQVDGELSERSSRKRQFEFARKALKRAAESPPGTVKGVMSQGLFVFCGENGDFRMSLVTGRVEGGKPVYNSFKRQTFFVRHDEVNRTFRDQTAQEFGDFKALCEAFSIEALAKQFYKELFAWYEWALSDEMDVRYPNDIHTNKDNRDLIPEHMIRLITRLMFVWFIKQKKLVPDEIFKVEELRKLLKDFDPDSETDGNYYNAILQNLFFATLNNQIEDRAFATNGTTKKKNVNHYGVKTLFRNPKGGSWFKVPDARILKLFEKVPFLNGGLFECLDRPEDEKTKHILYYDGFSREEQMDGKLTRAHVPNCLFFDEEYGLIPLFQRYNFTVEENSPNDAVVALDPELLGKVFENLLGAYNPETKETARKQSGSFYTPREIVSYMVDESLKQYLKTRTGVDDAVLAPLFEGEAKANLPAGKRKTLAAAIRAVKILDPACGSGAFPMGALHRLVDLLAKLEGQPENLYDLKLHLIENCIYGVDIQTIAVQISKLRFFISLVCEQEPNTNKSKNYGILPLPNLETKFVAANTLIGLEKEMGDELHLADEEISRLREKLKEVRHRHFSSKSSAEKQKLRKNDKELRKNIEKRIVSIASTPNLEKIADLEAQIRKLEAEKAKYEGEKWELVIEPAQGDLFGDQASNAPQKKRVDTHQAKREQLEGQIRWKQREIDAEKRKKATDVLLEEAEKLAKWNPYDQNESSPFFDPEWMFGMKDGFDVTIGNPPYVFARESKKKGLTSEDKKYFYENYELAEYQVNLYPLFVERGTKLLRPSGSLSFITPNNWLTINSNKAMRRFILSKSDITIVNFYARVFECADVDSSIIVFRNDGSSRNIRLYEYQDGLHFIKGADSDYFMQQRDHIINIQAFKMGGVGELMQKIETSSIVVGDVADVKVGLGAYGIGRGEPPQTEVMIEKRVYHATRKVSPKHFKYIDGKDVCRYYIGWAAGEYLKWGKNLREPRNDWRLFSTLRILVRQIPSKPPYCIEASLTEETFLNDRNSMNIINIREKPEYVLGILNSRLVSWWFIHKFGKMQRGTFPQFKVNELAVFPLPKDPKGQREEIARAVVKIMTAKRANPSADTVMLEREIDERVYRLYGLTTDEIAIVEGASTSPKKADKQEKAPRTVKAKSKTVLVDDEGLD